MIEEFNALFTQIQTGGALYFLVFLRVGTAVAVLPTFGERSIPARIRLVIGLSFALIVATALPDPPVWPDTSAGIFSLFFTETLIGLIFGLGIRLFVLALQTAGTIAAQAASLSQLFGGASVEPMPALGNLFVIGGLALLAILDLHVYITVAFLDSYAVAPVGVLLNPEPLMAWGVAQVSRAFALAFTLAAPFVLASLVYNLALGVINKAMPQLMVALVGAPAITGGTLVLLFLATPFLLQVWADALNAYLRAPFGQING